MILILKYKHGRFGWGKKAFLIQWNQWHIKHVKMSPDLKKQQKTKPKQRSTFDQNHVGKRKQGGNTWQHVYNTIFNWNVNLLSPEVKGQKAQICKAFFKTLLRGWLFSYWIEQQTFLKVLTRTAAEASTQSNSSKSYFTARSYSQLSWPNLSNDCQVTAVLCRRGSELRLLQDFPCH